MSDEVLVSLSVWSEVQMVCIWSSWCHYHRIISCVIKIQIGSPFWYRPTQVVLDKTPLNGRLLLYTISLFGLFDDFGEFICAEKDYRKQL